MEREGRILSARVMESGFNRDDKDFYVSVRYLLLSPSGRSLSRKESKIRPDFVTGKLPENGTAVLVLYLDDDNYRIL